MVSKRMGQGQKLLLCDDMDIKEIARSCGYDDIQYFYHVFRDIAGSAPAEFRRKYKK